MGQNATAMIVEDAEIERLKIRCNGLADRLELYKRMEASTGSGFFSSLIIVLCYLEQNDLVFKLQRQTKNQQFIYVQQTSFFELFSKRMPGYSEKQITEILKLFEIVDTSEKGYKMTYQGKRVLKLHAERFNFLTKGDAGA